MLPNLNHELKTFLRNHGVKHMFSAPFHPATNGQAEKYVQTLKRGLKALSSEPGNLQMKLNKFLLQYRKMPHITTGESPASLFLKRHIRTKIDLLIPNIGSKIQNKNDAQRFRKNRMRYFKINEKVAVRNYTPEAKWKMGTIIAKEGKLHYRVQVGPNIWRRHVDQIASMGTESHQEDVEQSEEKSDRNCLEENVGTERRVSFFEKPILTKNQQDQVSTVVPPETNSNEDVAMPSTESDSSTDIVQPSDDNNSADSEDSSPSTNKDNNIKNTNVSSSLLQVPRRSTRVRKAPERFKYDQK